MSKTHKVQKAWAHHNAGGPAVGPGNQAGSNAGLRHGNNRKSIAKDKVIERKQERSRSVTQTRRSSFDE